MSMTDALTIFVENFVINASGTTMNSNVFDTQGDNGTTTPTGSYGFGGGEPVYLVISNPVAFTTITSLDIKLRTSDTISGGALSGTINTLYDTTAIAIASLTGGILFPAGPVIVPVKGSLRYLDVLFTIVGPSTSEVGTITAILRESVDALQFIKYPIAAIS